MALVDCFPRYELSNPVYFIEKLNRALARLIRDRPNVHLLDVDQLAALKGRRYLQEDAFWPYNHGGLVTDHDYNTDRDRLDPHEPLSARYPNEVVAFIQGAWTEVKAMLATIAGTDMVKMVCVDLDDTLWRGVAAEADVLDQNAVEGWPLGLAETLLILKRRGLILAIVSKNDEAQAKAIMGELYGQRLRFDDFAIRKINWHSKVDNIRQAMSEANILPGSVVFIDDNPVERAAVKEAFPDIRILGSPHLDWRRILLWSAETQVPAITRESGRRTEMIQAQGEREATRGTMDRDTFLRQLDLSMTLDYLTSVEAPAFARALELLNKTNQFNTSGQRWTREEAAFCFGDGGI